MIKAVLAEGFIHTDGAVDKVHKCSLSLTDVGCKPKMQLLEVAWL